MKDVSIDSWFDRTFEDIDKSDNDKSEQNSISFKQILEAYQESKEQ